MAKEYANKPADAKTKKKLWMKIARYLFRAGKEADDRDVGGLGATESKKVNVEEVGLGETKVRAQCLVACACLLQMNLPLES